MSMERSSSPIDPRSEMAAAAAWLAEGGKNSGDGAVTSDLSIDEALLLHSLGWEPLELLWGIGDVYPGRRVDVGRGGCRRHLTRTTWPSMALRNESVRSAAKAGGHGVVGVGSRSRSIPTTWTLSWSVPRSGRWGAKKADRTPVRFRPLGPRFVLLSNAGWYPWASSFGASFIYAPRRDTATAIRQSGQNVELTNLTEALYAARETAMERMQTSGLRMSADGVVGVRIPRGLCSSLAMSSGSPRGEPPCT